MKFKITGLQPSVCLVTRGAKNPTAVGNNVAPDEWRLAPGHRARLRRKNKFGLRLNWHPPTADNNTYYGRLSPEQRTRLRRARRSAFGRIKTRLRRSITIRALCARTKSSPVASKTFGRNKKPPAAVNNTGDSRLNRGASRPDKELAYGEQKVGPSAKSEPAHGGQ